MAVVAPCQTASGGFRRGRVACSSNISCHASTSVPSRRAVCATSSASYHRTTRILCRGSGDSEAMPVRMTAEDACRLLDVQPTASFEEVLTAKNRKLAAADGNEDKVVAVEAAYDILFMRSMKKRMTGELEVSTNVRYADVPPAPPRRGPAAVSKGGSSKSAPAKQQVAGVTVEAPRNQQQVLVQSAVFGTLGLWALTQAVLETPDSQMADTAGLQMALALGYATYSLKENKRMDLTKALGLSFACLLAGALVGTALQAWLRVDIVPLGNFSSPGVLCTEVIILLLALGAIFLA